MSYLKGEMRISRAKIGMMENIGLSHEARDEIDVTKMKDMQNHNVCLSRLFLIG